MSDQHAHTSGHAHAAGHGHTNGHSHSADELDADEPRTPMWLPLLGGILFLSAAIFFLARSGNEATEGENAAKAAQEAPAPSPTAPSDAPSPRPVRIREVPEGNIQRIPPPGMPGGQLPPRGPEGVQPLPRPSGD